MLLLTLGPPLLGAAGLALTFLILERRGRGLIVVLAVLGIALLDVVLYPDTEATQAASVFHPNLAGQNLRLTQVAILFAVAARWAVHGLPRPSNKAVPLWWAFFAWVAVCTVVGLLRGHGTAMVLRQAMIIVQIGGTIVLAAGVPAEQYVRDRAVRAFIQLAAVLAGILIVVDLSGVRVSASVVPMLPLVGFGSLGADAATFLASLGLLGLGLGLCQERRPADGRHRRAGPRLALIAPSVVLLLAHLVSPQRAARVALYVALLILVLLMLGATARRRVKLSRTQSSVVLAALAALVVSGVLVTTAAAANSGSGLSGVLSEATGKQGFGFTTRQGSIESRTNQWETVRSQILAEPIFGEGLGGTFIHYDVGSRSRTEGDISHNIILDLLRRTGLVGLLLGAAAAGTVLRSGLTVWRRHSSDVVAGLAAAATAAALALLVRGMVESIFEKYRLALLLGVLLGLVMSAQASLSPTPGAPPPDGDS